MRWTFCAAAMWLVTTAVVASNSSRELRADDLADASSGLVVAPSRLRDTGLYAADQDERLAEGVRAFSPQYPLWTDGAEKSRWVYLPAESSIDTSDPYNWSFPVGVKFWKEFRFAGRKVETRFIWRASRDRWLFATYVWNDAQTDAVLAPEAGVRNIVEVSPGKRHSVPSANDCTACHGTTRTGPLGFNALQLSSDRDPNAIHAEPLLDGMVTLESLIQQRRLTSVPREWRERAPRIATGNPRTRTVMGYLVANCGGCHNGRGEIAALGPVLRMEDVMRDADAVAQGLLGQATRWQVNGRTEGSVLIDTEKPEESALLARLRSRSPSTQMPPLGTVIRDADAVRQVGDWISRDLAAAGRRSRR